MFKPIRNQSGTAIVFELVLVAAVLVFAGLGVYRYYQEANHTPTASTSGTQGKVVNRLDPPANGSVSGAGCSMR